MLFVSHNMHAIGNLTFHSIWLSHGRINYQGTSSDTISKYLLEQSNPEFIFDNSPSQYDACITKVELLTTFPNNTQESGKAMDIKIEVQTPVRIDGARLSIQIMNSTNESLAYFWYFGNGKSMELKPGKQKFICKIPNLRLYRGNYTLTVHLSEGNGKRKLQLLENICPFTIEIYGKQHAGNWQSGSCIYFEDFHWDWESIPQDLLPK